MNRKVDAKGYIGSLFGLRVWYFTVPFIIFMVIYAIFRHNATIISNEDNIKIYYVKYDEIVVKNSNNFDVDISLVVDTYMEDYVVAKNSKENINLIPGYNIIFINYNDTQRELTLEVEQQ